MGLIFFCLVVFISLGFFLGGRDFIGGGGWRFFLKRKKTQGLVSQSIIRTKFNRRKELFPKFIAYPFHKSPLTCIVGNFLGYV